MSEQNIEKQTLASGILNKLDSRLVEDIRRSYPAANLQEMIESLELVTSFYPAYPDFFWKILVTNPELSRFHVQKRSIQNGYHHIDPKSFMIYRLQDFCDDVFDVLFFEGLTERPERKPSIITNEINSIIKSDRRFRALDGGRNLDVKRFLQQFIQNMEEGDYRLSGPELSSKMFEEIYVLLDLSEIQDNQKNQYFLKYLRSLFAGVAQSVLKNAPGAVQATVAEVAEATAAAVAPQSDAGYGLRPL